jgi:hypothetical protein
MRGADVCIWRGVWRRRSHWADADDRAKRFGRAGGCAQPGTPRVGLASCVAVARLGRGVSHLDERTSSRRNV